MKYRSPAIGEKIKPSITAFVTGGFAILPTYFMVFENFTT